MPNYTRMGTFYGRSPVAETLPVTAGTIARQKSYYQAKRVFDVVGSLLLMGLVLSWLLPIVAFVIWYDSRGPVFFRQKRVGRGGRLFTCYKFRTMVLNEDADTLQATENDPRITRIGRWLRRANIDEWPQLLNVLTGDMSLVGPRPHMPSDCSRFAELVPGYAYRNEIRPGMTGPAQVKGYHGPTPDYESIYSRYRWDVFYVQHAGLRLDLEILARTLVQQLRTGW